MNSKLNNTMSATNIEIEYSSGGIERIGEVPIYAADALVRRAPSLQKTADAKNARCIFVAHDVAEKHGIVDGADVRVMQGEAAIVLRAKLDAGLASGCVRIAAALPETAALGPMFGIVTLEAISMAAAAE